MWKMLILIIRKNNNSTKTEDTVSEKFNFHLIKKKALRKALYSFTALLGMMTNLKSPLKKKTRVYFQST